MVVRPMDAPLEIIIYDEGQLAYRSRLAGIAEFGRQNIDEMAPYSQQDHAGTTRVVIAGLDEVTVPRRLVRVERIAADRVKLTNPSRIPLRLDAGPVLEPGNVREAALPVSFAVGSKSLALRSASDSSDDLQSLAESTFGPGADLAASLLLATAARGRMANDELDNESLLRWTQGIIMVLQSAVGTTDFFRRAVRALVDLVGLDYGCVLLRAENGWAVDESSRAGRAGTDDKGPASAAIDWKPSQQVLENVLRQKKTFWKQLDLATAQESLFGTQAVVASPILSARHEVIGVLYGERRRSGAGIATVSRLVAMLVEILAGGVAAGLARLEQEQAALRTRVLMEQFFTPDLSRHLVENPNLLTGRDAEVTMLSCDIRGFSRICNNLGPARTLEWVQDVLSTLSDCVLAEQGVLVDYVGDELLAMWGAPDEQPDHAERACRAALAMRGTVPMLNAKWKATVREDMGLSIGVSSGTSRVGNIGSARKFKYGALGTTVNLASRVQGATKYLKVPVLITGAVAERLSETFRTRRLCQLEVVNIADPVTVYQLGEPQSEDWAGLKETYEQALGHFEKREFRTTAHLLGELLTQRDDGPALTLMQRAVTYLVEEPKQFSAVWKLADKGK
jgi:adenylate cyclase